MKKLVKQKKIFFNKDKIILSKNYEVESIHLKMSVFHMRITKLL